MKHERTWTSLAMAAVLTVGAAGASCGRGGSGGNAPRVAPPGPLKVVSISPSQGPAAGGTAIAISGTGFLPGATVTLAGMDGTSIAVISPYLITAITPPNPGGPADVTASSAGRQDTLQGGFVYGSLPPIPVIYSVTPSSGPEGGGTFVTILGNDFQPGAVSSIGGVPLSSQEFVSFSVLQGIAPPGTAGFADVEVVNPDGGSWLLPSAYRYTTDPTFFITRITPSAGDMAGSTPVVVEGSGFTWGMEVALDGNALLSPLIPNFFTFTGDTPAGAAPGSVNVVATDSSGTLVSTIVDGFIYTAGPPPVNPTITALIPDNGPVGTLVTIQGQDFGATPAENLVRFGGAPTPVLTASPVELLAVAPPEASPGPVNVEVQGIRSNDADFTLTSPWIDFISPNCGAAPGMDVTIVGGSFSPDPTLNEVRFNGALAPVLAAGPTFLSVTVPGDAISGPIRVKVGGLVSPGVFFRVMNVLPDPSLTSVTPTTGAAGEMVTLTGTEISPTPGSNQVRFGGVVATVLSATTTALETLVPAGTTTGEVTLSVGGRDAPTGVPFTITSPPPPPPALLAIFPDSGSVGDPVYVEGAGFHPDPESNRVEFNGVAADVFAGALTWLLVAVPLSTSGPVVVDVGGQTSGGLPFTISGQGPGTESVDLFGQVLPLPTDRVIYVIDTSGSMAFAVPDYVDRFGNLVPGTRLDFVVDRVISSVQALPQTVRFNIFNFACNRQSWAPDTQFATGPNVSDAETWLLALAPFGGTGTGPALSAALGEEENRAVLLITDGQPNCGASGTTGHLCVALNRNVQEAVIHTFGIQAVGLFEQFLLDLAALTGGTYTSVLP